MNKNTLRTREFIAIFLLTIGLKLADFTPNIFFTELLNGAWLAPIICAITILIPLSMLFHLLKHTQTGLIESTNQYAGRLIGSILLLNLFFISLIATSVETRNYVEIMSTLFFPETSIITIYSSFILTCSLIVYGGIITIGRTAWVVVFYIKIAMLILVVLSFKEWNHLFLSPILGKGLQAIIKESVPSYSIFGELVVWSALIPFMTKPNEYKKASLISLGIATLEMVVMFLVYIMVFDSYSLETILYPFQQLTRSTNLGRFITNLEGYFFVFWMIASIVRFSTYIFVTVFLFQKLFKFDSHKPLVIPIAMLSMLIGLVPENNILSGFLYRETFLLTYTSIFLFALPFCLYIGYLINKRGNKK